MISRSVALILLALVAVKVTGPMQAQIATPRAESLFAGLDLPEIILTATDDGLTLSRSKVPAGRYLITLDNHSWDDLWVEFLRYGPDPPIGDATCRVGIAPECFTWYALVYHPGGVSAQAPQAILDLRGGEYGLWGPGVLSEHPAARLTVIGDRDAPITGPELAATSITAMSQQSGSGIDIHIDAELHSGPQLVRIVNSTDQLLRMFAAQYPQPITVEQVAAMEEAEMNDRVTPAPDALDPALFREIALTSPQSPGTNQWFVLDLDPGHLYLSTSFAAPITSELDPGWTMAGAVVVPVVES